MTKAECVCEPFFTRHIECDMQEEKHDGSFYTIRVWKAEYNGVKFNLHCDNYYGRSVLFVNGKRYGDIEVDYESLNAIVCKLAA